MFEFLENNLIILCITAIAIAYCLGQWRLIETNNQIISGEAHQVGGIQANDKAKA